MDLTTMSGRLEALYKAYGWTKEDVAEKVDVNLSTAYRWLSGTTPQPKNIDRIARAAGISRSWLVDGEGPVPGPIREWGLQQSPAIEATLSAEEGTGTCDRLSGATVPSDDRSFEVPVLDAKIGGAGEGRVVRCIALRRADLEGVVDGEIPEQVGGARCEDEGMIPDIRFGDIVIYEPVDEVRGFGRYVVAMGQWIMCRIVQRRADGTLRVKALQPGADPENLRPVDGGYVSAETGEPAAFEVIGRCLAILPDMQKKHSFAAQLHPS